MLDWKIHEQKMYLPSPEPRAIHVPKHAYFVIGCRGDIHSTDFSERIKVLVALSEAVRNIQQLGYSPPGFKDYHLYPAETLHHFDDHPGQGNPPPPFSLMIRQPGFIDNETIDRAFTEVHQQGFPLLPEVAFEELEDGLSVQLRGSEKQETVNEIFDKMERFLLMYGWRRRNRHHRVIYPDHTARPFDSMVYRIFVEEVQ